MHRIYDNDSVSDSGPFSCTILDDCCPDRFQIHHLSSSIYDLVAIKIISDMAGSVKFIPHSAAKTQHPATVQILHGTVAFSFHISYRDFAFRCEKE
jgi:hypothetical protein